VNGSTVSDTFSQRKQKTRLNNRPEQMHATTLCSSGGACGDKSDTDGDDNDTKGTERASGDAGDVDNGDDIDAANGEAKRSGDECGGGDLAW
jgi:hypothetical protein